MEDPDAIVVLAGGIKQDPSGRWVSLDLSEGDNALGAPGGKLRIHAAAVLSNRWPQVSVVTSGGKGSDVPEGTPEDRPPLAEILRDELVQSGVSVDRIILEQRSNSTYQQLQELETLIAEKKWKQVQLITNRYHLARLTAMIEAKFPVLAGVAQPLSAEEVLIGADPERWEILIIEAYESAWMKEREMKEAQGVEQIKNGTYQFR